MHAVHGCSNTHCMLLPPPVFSPFATSIITIGGEPECCLLDSPTCLGNCSCCGRRESRCCCCHHEGHSAEVGVTARGEVEGFPLLLLLPPIGALS